MKGTKISNRQLCFNVVRHPGCYFALLIAPLLSGCVVSNKETRGPGVEYALQTGPRPPQPKDKTKNNRQAPPRPQPRPPQLPLLPHGSGDAIPAAAAIYLKPGAAIDGLAGAIWADRNNDGYVDGYTYNGQYFAGAPAGYDAALGRVATGAVGAEAAEAVIPDVTVIPGAVIGAAVGGLPGAVWTDRNNDGLVDGYIYNGQYYPGLPPATVRVPATSGERG